MRKSVFWSVVLGILFSPGAGVFYGYMAISGDRKPWRVALIGTGICFSIIIILIMTLSFMTDNATYSASIPDTSPPLIISR